MSPLDRRTFLRGVLVAMAGTVAGCSGSQPVALDAPTGTPDPTTSPGPKPTPTPTPAAATATAPTGAATQPHTTPEQPEPTPGPTSEEPTRSEEPTVEDPGDPKHTRLEVICRDGWEASEAGRLDPHSVRQLTVHHTAVRLDDNRQAPSRLRQHQDYHQSLGWPDIAYHLGVDRNGHVYELRRPDVRGDTGTNYDPAGHLLVVALGHYGEQRPTPAQLEGIARAFAWGASTFGVGADTLTGHRDHASTSCPGDHLQARIPALRDRIGRLVAKGIDRRDVCGEEAQARIAAIEAGRDEPLET